MLFYCSVMCCRGVVVIHLFMLVLRHALTFTLFLGFATHNMAFCLFEAFYYHPGALFDYFLVLCLLVFFLSSFSVDSLC